MVELLSPGLPGERMVGRLKIGKPGTERRAKALDHRTRRTCFPNGLLEERFSEGEAQKAAMEV